MLRSLSPVAVALVALIVTARPVIAASKSFDFKDPKGVNAIAISMDSPLEPVSAIALGVSGTVTFDPDNPKRATGTIVVDTGTLDFGHPRYNEVARGPLALNEAAHPHIEFALKKVKSVKRNGHVFTGTVEGTFTCRGVTKPITFPLRATYLEGKGGERMRGGSGDLLILRTTFTIRRGDFGIAPSAPTPIVGDEVEIRANIVGVSAGTGTATTR